jgi:3-deoxy-D-manno-octulosonic-acid transferase
MLIVALPRYLGRMIRRGGYMAMMRGRFGLGKYLGPALPGRHRVWIHAVSVGELQAIIPIVESLCKRLDTQVVLTVTTSTAYALALQKLKATCLDIRPFPIDFQPFSAAAWRRIRPDLCLLMEGELWPEHLHQAKLHDVPVLLVNARLSDHSWKRYRRFMIPARNLLFDKISLILAGNEQDAKRFGLLGLKNVRYAGQLKCDAPVEPRLNARERRELREQLFPGIHDSSLVMLGSSTWPGEEAFLLNVLREARGHGTDLCLLLVPRHAERRDEVARLLDASTLKWHWRSRKGRPAEGTLVHLADTTGELRLLTQAADFALIGKSLPPHREGQSPIEAAALGVPSVMGPGMGNFRDITRGLCDAGASLRATDESNAMELLLKLASDADLRAKMSEKATAWFAAQKGARETTMKAIDELLTRITQDGE